METVSIIIPVYNVEKYLARCIDSVINQTYKALEIILVDDGSTDNSGHICDEYAQKDSRIKTIHQDNCGQSGARNAGLTAATGEYIGFLDSDDYIDSDMYEVLVENAQKYDCDISACGSRTVYMNGKIKCSHSSGETKVFDKNEALKEITNRMDSAVWNKIYKSSLVKDLSFEVGRVHGEDLYFILQCLSRCNRMSYEYACKHYYYKREGSTTTSTSVSHKMFDQIYFRDLIYNLIVKEFPDYEPVAKKWCFAARLNICRKIYMSKKCEEYKEILCEYRQYFMDNYRNIRHVLTTNEVIEYYLIRYVPLLYPSIMGLYLAKGKS